MDQNHFTTDTLRKKGAHLTFEERVIIQTRLRDKQSYRSIAREIGCCVNVEHISRVECWANTLPRKILGYKTPEECFREEMLAALTA